MATLKQSGVYGKVTKVFDPVGGKYSEPAFRAMAPGGRYVVFGFASGGADPKSAFPSFPINLLLMKGQHLVGSMDTNRAPEARQELFQMARDGRLKPGVATQQAEYSLDHFTQAFDDLANRKAVGKVIISVSPRSKL